MMTYSFSDIGGEYLYEHLYKCLKNDILSGLLRPHTKLPSKRNFAAHLGISVITVEKSYAQLTTEGYIFSQVKKGFFVADVTNLADSGRKRENPADFQADTEAEKTQSFEPYFADFVSNKTIPDNFPFSVWTKVLRQVIAEKNNELMTNSPFEGVYELRKAIALHLRDFRGMTVQPEHIVVGAGTEYLYGLIIQLLGYDKTYAVENPGYKKIADIYKSHTVKCVYIPMDGGGLHCESLKKSGAQVVHTAANHHYPTGLVMPIGRRYELLNWAAQQSDRYIIEDDYDSEFRLSGKPIPSLKSIDTAEKVIYLNTFSKSLSSTVRISYMILPDFLMKKFKKELGFYSCTVSTFEQYSLAKLIRENHFEKHINRARTYYRNCRDCIMKTITESERNKEVRVMESEAGLHFLLKLHTNISDAELKNKAALRGIRISCLSDYYHEAQNDGNNIVVINYSGVPLNKIPESIKRLLQCI